MRRRAFSLVELVVVLVIVAVLAGLLMPALWRARTKVRSEEHAEIVRSVDRAALSFEQTFGKRVPDELPLDVIANGATNLTCDTVAQGDDRQVVPIGTPCGRGTVLITAGVNGILETVVGGDDAALHGVFAAVDTTVQPVGQPKYVGAVDLNGEMPNRKLDAEECLYYFLSAAWRVKPQPPSTYTAQAFQEGQYWHDIGSFEFMPGPGLWKEDGGPFLQLDDRYVRDDDGDGYWGLYFGP